MNDNRELAIKPIMFINQGYIGNLSQNWMITHYYVSKKITQNILYSVYHKDKSIVEIAEMIGVKPSYVEEEINYLEVNGFIDKVSNNKYQTNMLIHDSSKEIIEKNHNLYQKCATDIIDLYIFKLIKQCKEIFYSNNDKLYIPLNDYNFFLWSMVTFACLYKLEIPFFKEKLLKFTTKRKDGSDYIATASVNRNIFFSFNDSIYNTYPSGMMTFNDIRIWQFNCAKDNRINDWSQSLPYKFKYLSIMKIRNERIQHEDPKPLEKMLQNNHFIANYNEKEYVNMLISKLSVEELLNLLPALPDDLVAINNFIAEEIFNQSKIFYPNHKHKLYNAYCYNLLYSDQVVVRVLNQLQNNNTLKPLTEIQKATLNMILFIN